MRVTYRFQAICLCFLSVASSIAWSDDLPKNANSSLVSVKTSDKKTLVGVLADSDDRGKNTVLEEVSSGKSIELTAAQVATKPLPLTDEEAIKLTGNPGAVVAWRIAQKIVQGTPKGKIAAITGGTIFTTLGSKDRLRPGSELFVYRGEEVIKDPDTGEVIGRQRRLVAKLDVVSVEEKSSKVRLQGDLDISLNVGDQVELPSGPPAIAVLPATDNEGTAFEGTVKIANEVVSQLVRRKFKVVERSKFKDAFVELAIQQTGFFDPATTAKVGKLVGASHVLTGSVTKAAKSSFKAEISLRLVSVETGDIVSATNFESYPFRFDPSADIDESGAITPRGKIDVLKEFKDVGRSTKRGSWQFGNGILSNLEDLSVVMLPIEIMNGSYEYSMDVNRTSGNQAIFVWLPVGQTAVYEKVGDFHGLETLNGQGVADVQNPTRRPGSFTNGKWQRLVINVRVMGRDCKITSSLDGVPIVDWSGRMTEITGADGWAPANRSQLGLAVLRSRVSFRDIQFTGAGKVVR